jgi:flagellin-like protein
MINLMRYGRPQSPFFGTMSLSIAYLMAATLYLYLDGRRDAALCARVSGRLQWFYRIWAAGYQDTPEQRETHDKAAFWLAVAILILVVVYHATLGFVFGLQVAQPGWFTPLLALWHLTLNAVSGIGGVLILVAATVRLTLGARDQLPTKIFG